MSREDTTIRISKKSKAQWEKVAKGVPIKHYVEAVGKCWAKVVQHFGSIEGVEKFIKEQKCKKK